MPSATRTLTIRTRFRSRPPVMTSALSNQVAQDARRGQRMPGCPAASTTPILHGNESGMDDRPRLVLNASVMVAKNVTAGTTTRSDNTQAMPLTVPNEGPRDITLGG